MGHRRNPYEHGAVVVVEYFDDTKRTFETDGSPAALMESIARDENVRSVIASGREERS